MEMRLKAVSGALLMLLFIAMLSFAFNVQSTSTEEEPGWSITSVTVSHCGKVVYKVCERIKWPLDVKVTVHNNGTAPLDITVNAYYYNATFTQQIGTSQTITNLAPGNNVTLTFSWDVSGFPLFFNYTVKANATDTGGGSDELVNGQVIREPCGWIDGDIDGDGDMDFFDLAKMILIYSGIITGPPELIERADLNGNCDVDFFDLGKMILIYSGYL